MALLGIRRTVALPLVLAAVAATGLAGCSGGDEPAPGAPVDAPVADFCRQLEDAPDADATADDFHDYADRLQRTGTPAQIDGDARRGFELFVDYLAVLEDDQVEKVKDSTQPADVFSGEEADKVESFKDGYVAACDPADDVETPSAEPTTELTGGPIEGLGAD